MSAFPGLTQVKRYQKSTKKSSRTSCPVSFQTISLLEHYWGLRLVRVHISLTGKTETNRNEVLWKIKQSLSTIWTLLDLGWCERFNSGPSCWESKGQHLCTSCSVKFQGLKFKLMKLRSAAVTSRTAKLFLNTRLQYLHFSEKSHNCLLMSQLQSSSCGDLWPHTSSWKREWERCWNVFQAITVWDYRAEQLEITGPHDVDDVDMNVFVLLLGV